MLLPRCPDATLHCVRWLQCCLTTKGLRVWGSMTHAHRELRPCLLACSDSLCDCSRPIAIIRIRRRLFAAALCGGLLLTQMFLFSVFQLIIHSFTNHVKSELNVFSFSTSTCTSSPVQSSYLKLYLVSILMHYDIYTCINLAFRFSLQWALCIFNFHLEYNCHHRVLSIEAPMFRYVISSGMNSTHGFSFNGADDASNFTLLSLPLLALSCSFHSRMLRL